MGPLYWLAFKRPNIKGFYIGSLSVCQFSTTKALGVNECPICI
jgi:hypothetical protein